MVGRSVDIPDDHFRANLPEALDVGVLGKGNDDGLIELTIQAVEQLKQANYRSPYRGRSIQIQDRRLARIRSALRRPAGQRQPNALKKGDPT